MPIEGAIRLRSHSIPLTICSTFEVNTFHFHFLLLLTQCTVCSEAYYCDRTCQKKKWKSHRHHCLYVRGQIESFTDAWRRLRFQGNYHGDARMSSMKDLPFYFGNSMVADFLNLKDNEWSVPHLTSDPSLQRDYNVLSVACGDIRNLVKTMGVLPDEFSGNLQVTMCDFDPFVMARNVVLLYMMVHYADVPDFSETFTSIWYSTQISNNDYQLLDVALETLSTSEQSLSQLTNGLVDMSSEEVAELKEVWQRWHTMQFEVGHPDCILVYEQRCERQKHLHVSKTYTIDGVPAKQVASYHKWYDDGIIAPSVSTRDDLPFYNPLVTGRTGSDATTPDVDYEKVFEDIDRTEVSKRKTPREFEFVYCLQTMAHPFCLWDYLDVEKLGFHMSITVQYHKYISSIVGRAINLIMKQQVSVVMTTVEFHELKFDDENGKKFDRIFTSNLVDYQELYGMMDFLGPQLDRDNPCSVIVMDALNSDYVSDPDGLIDQEELDLVNYCKRLSASTDEAQYGTKYYVRLEDYGYDADWYVRWIKARFRVERQYASDASIPSSKTVMQHGEYRMRDVRKERNRVVPFFYQGGVRKVGVPARRIRTFEWVIANN